MAGEKIDGGVILETMRDLAARLATEKQVASLVDAVKSMQAQNEERWSSVERRFKALDTKIDEIAEADRKAAAKLRDELVEAINDIEVPEGGGGSDEPPAWAVPLLSEIKDLFGFGKTLLGEKDVRDTLKRKVVKFLTKSDADPED